MSSAPLKVFCGKEEGLLDPSKFVCGKKSRCIESSGKWLTPHEFEVLAGKGKHYRWKKNIKTEDGKNFLTLMDEGVFKGHLSASENVPLKPKPETELTLITKDTDSDSGVSMTSITNQQSTLLKTVAPSTTVSEVKPSTQDLDYPSMVRQAIGSLTEGGTDCTNLNILLYVINRHNPNEDISTVHTKVRTSLSVLSRIGFLKKIGGEDESDSDADESRETKPDEPKKKKNKKLSPLQINGDDNRDQFDSNKKIKIEDQKSKVSKKRISGVEGDSPKRVMVFKPKRLSPTLAAFCGRKLLTRQEVIKRIWLHIKSRKLQDPKQKSKIICDKKLKTLFKKNKIDSSEMFAIIKMHMTNQ